VVRRIDLQLRKQHQATGDRRKSKGQGSYLGCGWNCVGIAWCFWHFGFLLAQPRFVLRYSDILASIVLFCWLCGFEDMDRSHGLWGQKDVYDIKTREMDGACVVARF
jgi:hypothetical protein